MSVFFILAGPNGAGKTTLSKQILATLIAKILSTQMKLPGL